MKQGKRNRPHLIIPHEDWVWIRNQKGYVKSLWEECWLADPYGSRPIKLETSLSDGSFTKARRVLHNAGLFEFIREVNNKDSRKTDCWKVRNLHRSRVKTYWKPTPKLPETENQNIPKKSIKTSKVKSRYYEFLQSDYWKEVRFKVILRDGYQCQECGKMVDLQVHHKTYKHHRRELEHLEDLITLCSQCHKNIHTSQASNTL